MLDKKEYQDLCDPRPINKIEGELWDLMTSKGWTVLKRGWPDFFCLKTEDGELRIVLVEVKPRRSKSLKRQQNLVMSILANRGIKCVKWSPPVVGSGFVSIETDDNIG